MQRGGATVEATLLTSETVNTYIYPHSSTWPEYSFGIGGRTVWLNGQLDINVKVYEDPSQYYGNAGFAGQGFSGAFAAAGSAGGTGLAGGGTGGASF